MTTVETATIRPLGPKTTEIRIRDFTLVQDKPVEFGGTDRGPMASEYFLAAWGACMTTTFMRIADIRKVPIDDVRIESSMAFDDKGRVTGLAMSLHARSGASEDAVAKAFDLAKRSCTISGLIGDIPVEYALSIQAPA